MRERKTNLVDEAILSIGIKCPSCGALFREDKETWTENCSDTSANEEEGQPYFVCAVVLCLGCSKPVVCMATLQPWDDVLVDFRVIYPNPSAPVVDENVPEGMRVDYTEACQVLPHSAKASAALSRRILQSILEDQGYEEKSLYEQVKRVLSEGDADRMLPAGLRDVVDAIRRFGNFSAHPVTSTTSSQIIEVEPEEAAWCLGIIEALFEHYYVRPAKNASMLNRLHEKLGSQL